MTTDTTERGLEDLICIAMTGRASIVTLPVEGWQSPPESYGGTGWLLGDARDYDREYCVDLVYLRDFLKATQPAIAEALELAGVDEGNSFLRQGEQLIHNFGRAIWLIGKSLFGQDKSVER